jgi:hypothetical protein
MTCDVEAINIVTGLVAGACIGSVLSLGLVVWQDLILDSFESCLFSLVQTNRRYLANKKKEQPLWVGL